MRLHPALSRILPSFVLTSACALSALAADDQGVVALPDYVVSSTVANQTPVGVTAMPVSALRYEPKVDVQARNLAETQADIAIRGGIFENTGIKVGAASLFDPQTGHYLAEIPVPPAMLGAPSVLTGSLNAAQGFNAGVGTIAYDWRAITTRGQASLAGGQYDFNAQSLYQGYKFASTGARQQLAADVEWARSASDGSVPFGEHDFERIGGRVQLRGANNQTDFYAGYQDKFFGWPNLYTPFGFNETEALQTALFLVNHRWWSAAGSTAEATVFYRRNRDDYEFNRAVPGASNPFQHKTWVRGAALAGTAKLPSFDLGYSVQAAHDNIESTSLTFGPYTSRDYVKASLVPSTTFTSNGGDVTLRGGLSYDDSNRDKSAVSPLAGIEWRRQDEKIYLEYSEATQLPTYTALKSNPSAGLFRGNQSLGRETSRNLELGVAGTLNGWSFESAVFCRWDDDLVDWTFQRGVTARTANPVDIRTTGYELVARHHTAAFDVVLGYTYLHKKADYRLAAVDASFYALNFPEHRVTAAITWRIGSGFELRSDNEYRQQKENLLRTIGGNDAVLSTLGLYYLPPQLKGWEFSVSVDNLWDSDFQEVPAVPASRRQTAAGITYRW